MDTYIIQSSKINQFINQVIDEVIDQVIDQVINQAIDQVINQAKRSTHRLQISQIKHFIGIKIYSQIFNLTLYDFIIRNVYN